jgi:hypothetical protein
VGVDVAEEAAVPLAAAMSKLGYRVGAEGAYAEGAGYSPGADGAGGGALGSR